MKKTKNSGQGWQPKTGAKCGCRLGIMRDNCPACEGTGYLIDFSAIRKRYEAKKETTTETPKVQP